jgi:hypothetical protein
VGEERAGDTVAFDAISALGFLSFLRSEALGRTIGGVDGGGFDAEAQCAEEQNLAQDKDHGKRGIAANQIRDGAHVGRRKGAWGWVAGMWRDGHGEACNWLELVLVCCRDQAQYRRSDLEGNSSKV